MKLIKPLVSLLILCLGSSFLFSQDFIKGADGFSKKKTCYITLNDGTELEGIMKDLDRKKGNIEEITIIPTGEKKKVSFEADKIKHMYLQPSGWDKFSKTMDFLYDATQWGEESELNSDLIKDGYAYFEQTEVQLKKSVRTLLMQLVNPSFEEKIRVYFDPYARESMSVGVAGIKVAGGIDKSYFVLHGDGPAYKLAKKNYEENKSGLFGRCNSMGDTMESWSKLAEAVYKHAKECPQE